MIERIRDIKDYLNSKNLSDHERWAIIRFLQIQLGSEVVE